MVGLAPGEPHHLCLTSGLGLRSKFSDVDDVDGKDTDTTLLARYHAVYSDARCRNWAISLQRLSTLHIAPLYIWVV